MPVAVAQIQPPGPPSVSQATVLTLPTGANPADVAITDLDGDLRPDVAVAERGLNNVRVFRQTTFGNFTAGVAYPTPPGPSGVVALGMDFPYLERNDLGVVCGRIVATYQNANDGQGTLAAQPLQYYGISNQPSVRPYVAAGFMDRDQFVDIVYTYDASPPNIGVGCLRHTGSTNFVSGGFYLQPGGVPTCVTLADLNGDAYLDILVNRPAANQIRLLPHNGFGAWVNTSQAVDLNTGGLQPVSIAAADVSGDQLADIAVANADNNTVGLLLNVSPWQYAAPVLFAQSAAPRQVLLLDLNNDSRTDLVTITADNLLNLWMNTGQPGPARFQLVQSLPTGPDPVVLKAADVVGDSNQDLIVACAGDNTVRIYRNTSRVLGTQTARLAGVEVYPNPATAELHLRLPRYAAHATEATLLDATGRVALRQLLPTGAAATLDVRQVPRGLYVLQLRNNDGIHSQKIVIRQ